MSGKRLLLIGVAVLSILAAAPTGLRAQVTTGGTVTGTVRDPSKAVVPGAELTLLREGTNVTQTTVSNSVGLYVFPAVAAGDYTLRCSAKGFRTAEVKQVHVEVLKTVTIDFTLELGMAAQIVEVSGGGLVEFIDQRRQHRLGDRRRAVEVFTRPGAQHYRVGTPATSCESQHLW